MVVVETLSSQLVQPSSKLESHGKIPVIESCNLDLVILDVYIKTVYFYTPHDMMRENAFFSPAHVLTHSLSRALSVFYPMAGRLHRKHERCIQILCNDAGALFVSARARGCLLDLQGFEPKAEFLSLIASLDSFPDEASRPLFTVQVTRFDCGGVALGLGVEHHVADGMSAISFLNAWASLARGKKLECHPYFDRTCLKARSPPMPLYPHYEYISLPPKPQINLPHTPHPLPKTHMFNITRDFVKKLKQTETMSQRCDPLSTYELLAAHIWRCACQARKLPKNEKSMLVTLVDGRTRMKNPSLPSEFFGNVIFTSCPTDKVGAIVENDLTYTAKTIRKEIRFVDSEYCHSTLDFLELQTDLSKFVKGAHTFASPNLGLISWTKLPLYETDFGWGKPIFIAPAFFPWEGHAYLLPSPTCDGSLRLFISLQDEHMALFEDLIQQCDTDL